jgi:RHS repeat-associated protein
MIGFRETALDQFAVEHTIEVNTLNGSAQLSVPIRTTPGRESFGPTLALGYESGEGNSTFGVGWFLTGVPSIGVDTSRSLPTYQAGDRYAYAGGQELVPYRRRQGAQWLPVVEQTGNYRVERFRSKVERSLERFEKWTDQASWREHWLAYARNGVVSVFGKTGDNSTRIADPSDPAHRTFQWLLEAQFDPKGNAIFYEYKAEDGVGVNPTLSFESRRMRAGGGFAQRYLKRILYGNSRPLSHAQPRDPANQWRFEVVFDYGEHGVGAIPTPSDAPPAAPWAVRKDPFSTHRPGFELRTYRLCRRVLTFHRFPELGGAPCLVGATEFSYQEDPGGTVLRSIRFQGYRKDLATGATTERAVPPLKMTYSAAQTGSSFESAEPVENAPLGLDGILYQWIDLKNEGLPGILHRQNQSWYFKDNLGDGRFGPLEIVGEVPAAVSAAFQLHDFDNDGDINLVGFEGREAGQYRRDRERGRWEGFQALHGLPRVDLANARVQWIDLNGDGHIDLIVDHLDRLVWYPSDGADGFSSPIELAKPDVSAGGAPTLTQSQRLHTFFADMTGDGLLDMVRIESGRVEYWPHLGRGKFGSGVVMESAPVIESFGEMDVARLRLVDLDGSGAASLVYIGRGELRYWVNKRGNSFGPEKRLCNLPYIDNLSSAQVFDFLGDGSRCLVWSTPLPSYEGQSLQFLRLTGDLPPRMLVSVTNSIGRETRLSYRSSARHYLRDRQGDRPWRTRLPRHSMVVDRLEGIDHVGGTRMVTRYEYRDGYFDSQERRFVGFGLVDAYDTDLHRATGTAAPEEVTPPSLARCWYHTGADNGFAKRAADFYSRDGLAVRPPLPAIEAIADLSTEEQLDAFRALAGVQWRQEFYAIRPDGTREPHPLRTTEFGYRIRRLQPIEKERDGAFSFFQSELLSHEYEQDPSDPRVTHEVLVEADAYGNVGKRVTLAYPRRPAGPIIRPEQRLLHAELLQRTYTNIDTADRFEVGIETEERRYCLTGLTPGANNAFSREDLLSQVAVAFTSPLAFHEVPGAAAPQARLIGMRRNLFWNDALTAALTLGQVGAVTLLHHVERAALPDAAVYSAFGGHVTGALLSSDGHYRSADGHWWAEDTTYRYHGAAAFYRLAQESNPGGNCQTFTFDMHSLLVTAVEDIFGNRVESVPDYQVLASSQVKDANDNISETLYDPLGVTVVTGVRGQQLGSNGNPHPVGADNLVTYAPQVGHTAADVLADPARFLQNASRFLFYDLEAFERGDGPPRTIHLEREQHAHNGEGAAPSPSRIRVTVSYIDGFGRPIQTKARADAGPAIQRDPAGAVVVDGNDTPVLAHSAERWLTSGHDVYNNKGWLVREYEPLFSTSPAFESDDALRHYGVATRTHYDPVGRIIRQDLPNGTFTSSAYTAWETRQSDANDNVVGSAYEAARLPLPASDPEKDALTKAQAHARTPTIMENDVLGRPFRLRELDEGGVERVTTTIYGVMGLPDRVVDPRGLTAFTYRYDMLGRTLFEQSIDAGDRWTLFDVHGRAVHRWDGRGVHLERRYDQNGRLTETRVDGALGLNNVVERIVYGDNPVAPQAKLKNARGRAVELYDDAGVLRFERYHMDGQAIDTSRTLRSGTDAYKVTVDWSNPPAVTLGGVQYRSKNRLDGLGRIEAQSLPDGTTREYDYAALGHVAEARITTANGQLNRQVVASSIETNARGQRTRMRFGNGVETSYEYAPSTFRLERLYTRRVLGAPRDYLDVEYTYDPAGNITRWIDRAQDPGARTPVIQGLTTSSACEFTYDAFYQLKRATCRAHQALLEHDYRDGLPDPNAIKGTRHLGLNNGAAVERYTRLYDYDLAGNIQRIRHQGVTQNWTTEIWTSPTSNRSLPKKDLNGIEVINPESRFDENGNNIHLPHLRSMDWNHYNRLSRAVVIDRSTAGGPDDAEYYVYGADGLRVRRVTERLVAGQVEVTETTYFDGCEIRRISRGGAIRLLRTTSHITDGSARVATLHQWSIDQTGLETDNIAEKKLHYLVDNHLGSVSLELDEAGDVISYEEYFPFGGTSFIAGRNARDVKLKEYRYSGKCRDDATGFYCYEYRYYAPFIGGWLSPDPLGPVDGLNLYRFVHNNPIRFVDADGLETVWGWVSPTASERQAIAEFNRYRAIEVGFRVTDLSTRINPTTGEKEWWIEKVKPLDSRLLEYARKEEISDLDVAEGLFVLNEAFEEGLATVVDDAARSEDQTESRDKADTHTQSVDGAGKPSAHPADGRSGAGATQQGQTGETGSNGNATTGPGPGASQEGRERGSGGQGTTSGQGPQGTGTGGGIGTGPGAGTGTGGGRGAGPRADGSGPGAGDPRGRAGGRPGGADTSGSSSSQSSGNATNGGTVMPPAPAGVSTGPEGILYSPDMQLPEVMPEAGIPVTDPSQIRFDMGGSDTRSVPGTESGSGVRPGGLEGGATERTPGATGQGAARWPLDVREGGEPGGESGGIRGGGGDLTLPSWLANPINAILDLSAAVADAVQFGLDVIGLVPGLGEIADGLNGLISLARGDYAGAALSFAAMIPFAGWVATAGKFGKRTAKAVDAVGDVTRVVTKHGDEAASVVSTVSRNADEAAQLASKNADELAQGNRKLFRGMKETAEGLPEVGDTARTLGVRPGLDIPVEGGIVKPGTGGMSVAPDTPMNLPSHRRPPGFGGTGKDPVWQIGEADLGPNLRFRPDSPTHGVIEPAVEMSMDVFRKALSDLQGIWSKL